MSLPIVEQISMDVELTLAGIRTSAGYNNQLIVERRKRLGNIPKDSLCVIFQGDPVRLGELSGAGGHIMWNQPYMLEVFVVESESNPDPIDRRINIIRSDIEKALMVDPHRNNLAHKTTLGNPQMFNDGNGGLTGIQMPFEVQYDTVEDDPYVRG